MKILCPAILALLTMTLQYSSGGAPSPAAAASPAQRMEQKLQHLQQNGARAHPDPTPTVLTEEEVNAYLASGRVALPKGVQRVRFQGSPGTVNALARVDFDKLTEGKRSSNPLLAIFSGVHDIAAVARAGGNQGMAQVHVDSVSLDGIEIPRMALNFFIDRYVKPKYPQAGLDSAFRLPARIDTAVVGENQLTLVQK